MTRLSDLADVLVECRVVTGDRWERAARAAGGDLARILAALAAGPPDWWDGKPPAPPGLTDYQRDAIAARFATGNLDLLRRDLARNQFLLLDKLGQGGQGAVYRARQLNPPRYAAVKTLIRDTEVRRRRFEQEARTMMRIQHPAVARFYLYERVRDAAGVPTDEYLIAMEFVSGTTLNRLVRRAGPVPWPFAVRWVVELLGGLATIHKSGLVHRDVKPENIMALGPAPGPGVDPERTAVKLLDFGAVKRSDADAGDGVTASRVFIGTVEYAPPEQWTDKTVAATDLYALGGTLYYLLTGRTPFQKTRRDMAAYRESHLNDPVPHLRQAVPDVPAELDRLFRRMMAKDPAERGTAAGLAEEFRRLLPRETRTVASPSAPPGREKAGSEPEDKPFPFRVAGSALTVLERVFLPAHHRPRPGYEPPPPERLAALLRRPVVLLLLVLALVGLLVLWLRW
jgi:serine/threonine protein kinase